MKWVLIVLIEGGPAYSDPAFCMQEFDTQEACENAAMLIHEKNKETRSTLKYTLCVPKGKAEDA